MGRGSIESAGKGGRSGPGVGSGANDAGGHAAENTAGHAVSKSGGDTASRPWIVLKFGGTSVSSRERWQTIADQVVERVRDGYLPLVVCSALSGISNALEALLVQAVDGGHDARLKEIARRHHDLGSSLEVDSEALLGADLIELSRLALGISLVHEKSPRVRARVMAFGELMATRLGAAFLQNQGIGACWLDVRSVLQAEERPNLPLERRYLSAACLFDPDPEMEAGLRTMAGSHDVILTQGFIAGNSEGETVLLGRGGSDTSAAYLAARLQAERLEIWTDVPGLFTANPREIPSARLLRRLEYLEAQELATMGAKVLHPRCLEPVRRTGIPLHIRCTQAPQLEGTIISRRSADHGARIKSIASKAGVTLISMDTLGMWGEVGFLADLFTIFREHGFSVDLVATSETNVTVSLDAGAQAMDQEQLDVLLRDLNRFCTADRIGPCAVVSLIGREIRSILHEMGPVFEAFREQRILQVSQAASDLNFSFVVDEDRASRIVQRLHSALFDKHAPDALLGPSWDELSVEPAPGATGGRPNAPVWWQRRRDDLLAMAAERDALYVYDEATLRQDAAQLRSIPGVDRVFYAMKANSDPGVLRVFHQEGLGFECVSPGEVRLLRELFGPVDPRRILFTPNFAPREDYAFALSEGVFVTLDSPYPLEAWPELFAGREVLVRLDPGRGYGHHKHVRTAGEQSKFGMDPGELERLRRIARDGGVKITGLHAHLGSGIEAAETWGETATFLAALAEGFPDVRYLDVGGGLAVPERQGSNGLDLAVVSEGLAAAKEAYPGFEVWLEPGRYLVAGAGVLLARVTQIKRKGYATYVGIATGMNSFIRPALYGAYHEIVNLSKLGNAPVMTADVVGPICETGDVLGYARHLPDTGEGDVLLIANAGAYGAAMSSHYNTREPAPGVMLAG